MFQRLISVRKPDVMDGYLYFELVKATAYIQDQLLKLGLVSGTDFFTTLNPPDWVRVWRSPGGEVKVLMVVP